MEPEQLFRYLGASRVQIGEQQILLPGEPDAGTEAGDDLMQRCLQRMALGVGDPAALDEDAVEEAAVGLPVAAEVVVERQCLMLDRRFQRERGSPLELLPESIHPPLGDQI